MKILIRSTSKIYAGASSKPEGASDSFLDTTNFDEYNDLLSNPQASNTLTAEVVWMEPMDYIKRCADSKGVSVDTLLSEGIEEYLVNQYAEQMKSGTKFPMPYLVHNANGRIDQDGQHRALASEAIGDKFIPVVVVKPLVAHIIDPKYDKSKHEIKILVVEVPANYTGSLGKEFTEFSLDNCLKLYNLDSEFLLIFDIYYGAEWQDMNNFIHDDLYTLMVDLADGIDANGTPPIYKYHFMKNANGEVVFAKWYLRKEDSYDDEVYDLINTRIAPQLLAYYAK